MKLISSLFPGSIEVDDTAVTTFVIENKGLFLKILRNLYSQWQGGSGEIIISDNDRILKAADCIEMITDFVGFVPDNKKTVARIQRMLEDELLSNHYTEINELLYRIERRLDLAAGIFPFSIGFDGIGLSALIKMAAPKIIDDSSTPIEGILNYFNIIRELFGERVYVLAGMRDYFSDEEMQEFVNTAVLHKYKVLLIESHESSILSNERRTLLDNDICLI